MSKAIWDEIDQNNFVLPSGKPLSLGAFFGGPCPEVLIEPAALGQPLPEMPLFLTPDDYVLVQLETTYWSAWEGVPAFWRHALGAPSSP
jgi:hypothetical protein